MRWLPAQRYLSRNSSQRSRSAVATRSKKPSRPRTASPNTALLSFDDDLDAPVLRVTNEDVPLPYAANLEKLALIKAADVVKAAKAVSYR